MLTLAITGRRRNVTRRDLSWYAAADREACENLRAAGLLRAALRRCDGRGVVMLLETPTAAGVLKALDELPTVQMGAVAYRTLAVEPFGATAAPPSFPTAQTERGKAGDDT